MDHRCIRQAMGVEVGVLQCAVGGFHQEIDGAKEMLQRSSLSTHVRPWLEGRTSEECTDFATKTAKKPLHHTYLSSHCCKSALYSLYPSPSNDEIANYVIVISKTPQLTSKHTSIKFDHNNHQRQTMDTQMHRAEQMSTSHFPFAPRNDVGITMVFHRMYGARKLGPRWNT